VWRSDRNRYDNFRRAELTERFNGGAHARSGGDAVVDKNHDAIFHVQRRHAAAIHELATIEFLHFSLDYGVERGIRNGQLLDYRGVQDTNASRGDRAEGELFMLRHAQLADDEDVEGRGESTSDFSRDGDAPARQAEYDDIWIFAKSR
jgi:hypothetical protein